MEDFKGEQCIFAIDLASKRDLTTCVAVFRRGGDYYVFGKHYLPSDAIVAGMPNYDVYRGWERDGKLNVTEGNRTDYARIEADVIEDNREYKPQRVGVDPNYNAVQFAQDMQAAGVPIEEIQHNTTQFSNPMKELDALVVAGRIHHNGDPVLTWAMGNVTAKQDVKGNVYPRRGRDTQKIDPAVALIANMSLQLKTDQSPAWDFKVLAI